MAKRVPTQFIVAAFTNEDAVDRIERTVMDSEWEAKQVLCTNMAVAKKDIAGKMHIKEMGSPSSIKDDNKRIGKLVGGLALLLIGKNGTLTGKTKGGAISKFGASHIEGMDKEKLSKLGNALEPGCSAIVLVFDEVFVDKEEGEAFLADYKTSTDSIFEEMDEKISSSLKSGKNISYHFCIDDDGVHLTREIVGVGAADVRDMVLTPTTTQLTSATATQSGRVTTHKRLITPDIYASTRAAMTNSMTMYTATTITDDGMTMESGMVHESKSTEE